MNVWILGLILLAGLGGGYAYVEFNRPEQPLPVVPANEVPAEETVVEESSSLPAATFSGTLEEVHEGCYVDAECYVVVDGKKVTVMLGWRNEVVGSVQGVSDFGALTGHIGKRMEVYAKKNGNQTYTLYGDARYYVRLLK